MMVVRSAERKPARSWSDRALLQMSFTDATNLHLISAPKIRNEINAPAMVQKS
jgi:hypothetical protein